jgi:RNA recognition motif-containing protein
MKIYVGNLSRETTEDDLRKVFEAFGQVRSVNIVRDGTTAESQGFGFVTMPSATEAQTAIQKLRGKDLNGQNITVEKGRMQTNLATSRRRRGGPIGGGHGGRGQRGGPARHGRRRRRY